MIWSWKKIWIQKFNDFWLASTKRVQWTLNHRSHNFIIPPGKDRWLASSIGLPWPLTIRHLLGVAPSTFTVVYICCLKKNTPVGMGMFGNFFVHPPILTTKRPKSFSVTGLRTSEGISISYDTIKDYHDIKIYKAYVIIVLSHVIWYYINWVDWTIDEFQVFVCYMTTCLMFCFSWTLLHFRFNQSWTVWIGCMNLNCLLNVNILSVARYTITCIDRSVMHVNIRCVSMCRGVKQLVRAQTAWYPTETGWRIDVPRLSGPPFRPNSATKKKQLQALLSNESWLVNRDRYNGLS